MYQKIKALLSDDGVFYSLIILLIGVASFGLGRWSVLDAVSAGQPASISMIQAPATIAAESETTSATVATAQYVASKNGTKYHALDCPGAKQISEANKIYFTTAAEAKSSGYGPAANCPGL